jgi:hypothetical protein
MVFKSANSFNFEIINFRFVSFCFLFVTFGQKKKCIAQCLLEKIKYNPLKVRSCGI